MQSYSSRLRACLSPTERRVFEPLKSPQRVQDYLDRLPINFEISGESYMSPRRVLKERTAHCMEGALLAAAALAYHDRLPLLMDLRSVKGDEDHVVALFKEGDYWGAISKTNHAVLRYRDPVYASVRELAMSYVHEYYLSNGTKTLREASRPFSLRRYAPRSWVIANEDLDWLAEALDDAPHFPLVTKKTAKLLRRASSFERTTLEATEWSR